MYAEMDACHLLETILKIYFVLNATQIDFILVHHLFARAYHIVIVDMSIELVIRSFITGIRNDTVSYYLYDGLLIF